MNHPADAISGWGRTTTDLLLIGIALAVPVLSWLWAQRIGDSVWFARSGSIMVVIGIVLESRMFITKQVLYQLSRQRGEDGLAEVPRMLLQKVEAWSTHVILIVGTIVWGYGDIVIARILFDV